MNKIFRNSLYNIIRAVILVPTFFFLIPYTIAKIGTAAYGIWALTGVISSYQVFVDLGLTTAIIRFVAKEEAVKNYKALSEYIVVALCIYITIPLIFVFLIIACRGLIVTYILGIKQNQEIALFLITITTVSSFINLLSGLFKSVIDGMQRMDLSNIIVTVQVLLSALGTVYFLESGFGLWGLAINLLLTSIFSLICNIYFSKRVLPQYSLNISLFKISRFKEIFSYSVNLQLSSLARFWVEPLNKVIISHLYSVSYVGFYDIALKLINQLNSLVNSALSPIFPASAEIHELHGMDKVELLRKKSLKYILPASIAMYSFVFMVVPGFVKLWLSPELSIISPVIQIFLLSSFLITLSIPAYTILNGLGYANDTFKVQIQSLVINLVGIASLSQITGFLGFCTAFSISIMYSFFATHYYYRKRFSDEINVYRQFLDKKMIIWGAMVILSEVIIAYFIPFTSYWKIAVGGIICAIVFTGLIVKFRIFNAADMESLLGEKVVNKFIVRHCNSK